MNYCCLSKLMLPTAFVLCRLWLPYIFFTVILMINHVFDNDNDVVQAPFYTPIKIKSMSLYSADVNYNLISFLILKAFRGPSISCKIANSIANIIINEINYFTFYQKRIAEEIFGRKNIRPF